MQPSILIADSEEETRSYVEKYFSDIKCRVMTCKNGLEVVQAFNSIRFDVMFLDVMGCNQWFEWGFLGGEKDSSHGKWSVCHGSGSSFWLTHRYRRVA